VFHIFGALSEFERSLIVERTQARLRAARARGLKGGRPKALGKDKREVAIQLYNQKKLTINQICEMMEISKPTLYKYIDASLEDIGKPVESKRE
jgi:DNA invertase Pin-like site-specific DNA recombinase